MPIDVDEVQRRKAIAKATLTVAARDGARAVTIRAVARELGGSTAMVTNYVPTRIALITNAVAAAESRWNGELEEHVDGLDGRERLHATVAWNLTTDPDDLQLRRLWVEMLSSVQSGAESADAAQTREPAATRRELLDAVTAAGVADPELAADLLFLLVRGYFISTVEDPEPWTPERVARVANAIVDMLTRRPAGTD
ncbi:TetR/AcrR family transcriptional regulator [Embleya sp. NPDC008237]|uniref:TetR/AcrR family transcriptional regulator n=1 Tax=Embleya sp. NPDC008237 TaxID=3363978 RepID=UPI0036F0E5FA